MSRNGHPVIIYSPEIICYCDRALKPSLKRFLLEDIRDPTGVTQNGLGGPPSLAPLQKAAKASKKKLERGQQRITQLLDSDSFLTKVLKELEDLGLVRTFKESLLLRVAMSTGSYGYETEKGDKLVNGKGQVLMTEKKRTEAIAHFKSMGRMYPEEIDM
jgi:hypothetical protein